MKQLYTLTLMIALFLATGITAQDYLPFANSNYAGITGVHLQPASIVDSRYKEDRVIGERSCSVLYLLFQCCSGIALLFNQIPFIYQHNKTFVVPDY